MKLVKYILIFLLNYIRSWPFVGMELLKLLLLSLYHATLSWKFSDRDIIRAPVKVNALH